MQPPQVFVAAGTQALECALAYLESERDAYGWYIGRRHDGSFAQAYFFIEDLFASAPERYETASDVHAHWSLDEARRHELAAMQEIFAREWLELDPGVVRVRSAQRGKLVEGTYYSPAFEGVVLRHVAKHWPLAYRPNLARVEAQQRRRRAGHSRP
jgi:hypothetical protein